VSTVPPVVVLDSDTLSELSRGAPRVTARARAYLTQHGRLTITAVTVFERLRGYHAALRAGKPFQQQLAAFETLVATCIVLPFDSDAADRAALICAALARKEQRAIGDIFIAAIASTRGLPLATRNRRDFAPMVALPFTGLQLEDWSK
jgi:predicted nucleic acid-binding protein